MTTWTVSDNIQSIPAQPNFFSPATPLLIRKIIFSTADQNSSIHQIILKTDTFNNAPELTISTTSPETKLEIRFAFLLLSGNMCVFSNAENNSVTITDIQNVDANHNIESLLSLIERHSGDISNEVYTSQIRTELGAVLSNAVEDDIENTIIENNEGVIGYYLTPETEPMFPDVPNDNLSLHPALNAKFGG
ncbi:MAG: hypothetical protein HKM04_04770 [Legionellales bacterium]|nr:hypothetical protein [Legionellales bacterium]